VPTVRPTAARRFRAARNMTLIHDLALAHPCAARIAGPLRPDANALAQPQET
jgi:hypothetical protein